MKLNCQIEFKRPETLPDPLDKYLECLSILHKKIGYQQLIMRLHPISVKWAMESGYNVDVFNNKMVFTHVSLT